MFPIIVVLLVATTFTTLILIHVLVRQINATNSVPQIRHKLRWDFGDIKKIKQIHRRVLPGSKTYEVFRGFELFQITVAVCIVIFFITVALKHFDPAR